MSASSVTDRPAPPATPARSVSAWWAPLAGLVVVALAFAVTEMLAALGIWFGWLADASSPVQSLANTFIFFTPEWLKSFAIDTFGTNDKIALGAGMFLTIAIVALILGLVARRRPPVAMVLLVLLAAVAGAAVLSRARTTVVDLVPLLIGTVVGLLALRLAFQIHDAATRSGHQRDAEKDRAAERAPARSGSTPVTTSNPVRRRTFFQVLGVSAVVAAIAGTAARFIPTGASALASRSGLVLPAPTEPYTVPAGAALDVPGISPLVTPNADFYRIDTEFDPPQLSAADWSLQITGMVERPTSLDYQQLSDREQIEVPITLTCVSNEVGGGLVGNAVWRGTRIDDLLAEARPMEGADCVLCTDVNGFTLSAPLEALTDGRDALLAIGMNGEPLPIEHGFPVRMVVPGLYGFVSATKWLVSMEVTRFSDVVAYWTARGWSDKGPIKMSSRIDTPASFAKLPAGSNVVGGMAWAQHTGIEKVEIQVDDGDWKPADLSTPLSVDTWMQWKFVWEAGDTGLHTLRVRATDKDGNVQVEDRVQPIPNGSSGWQSRQVTVV